MRAQRVRISLFVILCAAIVWPVLAAAGEQQSVDHSRRIEFLEQFYGQFASERAEAAADVLPLNASWHMIGWRQDVVPFAGVYSGREKLREFFSKYFDAIHIREYRFEYKLTDGNYTNWHFRLIADVPATGKTFDAEFVHVWQFDSNDQPVFVRCYYDTQLQAEAFTSGGPTELTDHKDPADDYVVRSTSCDVQALVAKVYDLFYTGDIPGVFALLSPDAAVYFQGKNNPQSGEYHGFAGILQFVYNLAGTAYPGEISRFYVTEGNRTDVVLFENWTVYATGKSYHVHTVNSWRVDDNGLLLGFINYPDDDEVAAAYVP